MDNSMTQWLIFLLGAATLHGCWLAVLLFLKKRQDKAARLLGAAFIIVSLYLLNYLLFLTGVIRIFPHLLGVFYPTFFLLGPCYYFFIRRSLEPGFSSKKIHLLHFLPAAMILARTSKLYLAPVDFKLKIIDWSLNPAGSFTWTDVLLGNDYLYLVMVYVAAAWMLARRVENTASDGQNRLQARWLRQFSAGFLALLALDLILKFTFFALQTPAFSMEYAMASVIAFGIHAAGYRAIGRLGDFPKIRPGAPPENGKYKTSPLTPDQMESYRDALLVLMKNEKPYLDAALKIGDLAARLDMPSHHLSQVLNEGMETNFYDFVNTYRVEEVKRRLKDEKFRHYSILAIGLECGFANKTTFNRTFKKYVGMTPSEFAGLGAVT